MEHPSLTPLGAPDISQLDADDDVKEAITQYLGNKWLKAFTSKAANTLFWVTDLNGRVLFSAGGRRPPNSFAGGTVGQTWGASPEYAAAVATLMERPITDPDGDTYTQLATAAFAGHTYVNDYCLIRSPSGRPIAVAVLTIDITNAQGSCPCSSSSG